MKNHFFIKLISIFIIIAASFLGYKIYTLNNKPAIIYKYTQIQIPLKGEIIWDDTSIKSISVKNENNETMDTYVFPSVDGKTLFINPPIDGFYEDDKICVTLSPNLHFKNYKMTEEKKLYFQVKSGDNITLSKVHKEPQYGDIIGTEDTFMGYQYTHYGIYVGNNKVIHYCSNTGNSKDAEIKETDMSPYFRNGHYFILNIKGNSQFDSKETVKRAKIREGEKSYNLLQNNCEHFAIWAKTGYSMSYQIDSLSQEKLAQLKIFTAMGINLQ